MADVGVRRRAKKHACGQQQLNRVGHGTTVRLRRSQDRCPLPVVPGCCTVPLTAAVGLSHHSGDGTFGTGHARPSIWRGDGPQNAPSTALVRVPPAPVLAQVAEACGSAIAHYDTGHLQAHLQHSSRDHAGARPPARLRR